MSRASVGSFQPVSITEDRAHTSNPGKVYLPMSSFLTFKVRICRESSGMCCCLSSCTRSDCSSLLCTHCIVFLFVLHFVFSPVAVLRSLFVNESCGINNSGGASFSSVRWLLIGAAGCNLLKCNHLSLEMPPGWRGGRRLPPS